MLSSYIYSMPYTFYYLSRRHADNLQYLVNYILKKFYIIFRYKFASSS